ncbi:MAG TPA: hypothetical protein PLB16_06275 [bacterium]|nr:hypothetical protein [bacterium]
MKVSVKIGFLMLFFFLFLGCSKNIEGNFLCDKELMSIKKENEQTVLKIVKISPATELSDARNTLSLVKNENVYTTSVFGSTISVSKAEEGIMFVGPNGSQVCKIIDLSSGKSNFSEEKVKNYIQIKVIDIIKKDLDSKSYNCGSYGLSKNKREHLENLLEKVSYTAIKSTSKKEHLFFDEYEFESEMVFPEFKNEIESKICKSKKYVWGQEKCLSWEDGAMEIRTNAYSLKIKGKIYEPRFPEIEEKENFVISSIGDSEKYLFTDAVCKDVFLSKDALNYQETVIKK